MFQCSLIVTLFNWNPALPKFTPNWQEARVLTERIAGSRDPDITFQVFDDKGERFDIARWKFGKLTDPKIRQWLASRQDDGCGIFHVINECDGNGRRRANVVDARACFVDFDGEPLPDAWVVQPDMIVESSAGKFHAYWLINPTSDLNAWSDCQVRLATYYSGDRRVFDPPRVLRLPGFMHQKGKPYRTKIADLQPEPFPRRELSELADAHPCDYKRPAERLESGRSDEPVDGWDKPDDIERAKYLINSRKKPLPGDRNNAAYRAAAILNDFAISPAKSLEMLEEWNNLLDEPLPLSEIQHVIRSAPEYKASPAGSRSASPAADDFEEDLTDEDLQRLDKLNPKRADDDATMFEGEDDKKVSHELSAEDFEGKDVTIKRNLGGMSWSWGDEVVAEELEWLWQWRVPRGKLTILAGFPDQGKSLTMLSVAAIVSNGGKWPDSTDHCEEGVAIILSAEDDEADTLIPRLVAADANLKNIVIVRSMVRVVTEGKKTRRVLNIDDDLAQIAALVKQIRLAGKVVRLICIDPIGAYFGGGKAGKADSHKNSDMRALLTPVTEFAARLRIAILAISHFNKGGNAHVLYRVTDSGAITAAARSVYYAIRPEKESDNSEEISRIFVPGKHNLAPDDIGGLEYSIDARDIGDKIKLSAGKMTPFIKWGGATKLTAEQALGVPKERKSGQHREIVSWLYEVLADGPMHVPDIEAACKAKGLSWRTVTGVRDKRGGDDWILSERVPKSWFDERFEPVTTRWQWHPPSINIPDNEFPTDQEDDD